MSWCLQSNKLIPVRMRIAQDTTNNIHKTFSFLSLWIDCENSDTLPWLRF